MQLRLRLVRAIIAPLALCIGATASTSPYTSAAPDVAPPMAVVLEGDPGTSSTCYSCIFYDPHTVYCDTYMNGDQYGPYDSCDELVLPCDPWGPFPEEACSACVMGNPCSPALETPVSLVSGNGSIGQFRATTIEKESQSVVSRSCNGFVLESRFSAQRASEVNEALRVLSL